MIKYTFLRDFHKGICSLKSNQRPIHKKCNVHHPDGAKKESHACLQLPGCEGRASLSSRVCWAGSRSYYLALGIVKVWLCLETKSGQPGKLLRVDSLCEFTSHYRILDHSISTKLSGVTETSRCLDAPDTFSSQKALWLAFDPQKIAP